VLADTTQFGKLFHVFTTLLIKPNFRRSYFTWDSDRYLGLQMHFLGLHKPRTGRTGHTGRTGGFVNHAPAILATLALIYSTHRLLVVWPIVVHFHLCSLLDSYTALEVWTVRRPMRVCCGCRRGRCVLFTNILDSLTVPCLVYNTAMYTVYGRCGQYGRCMVHTLAGAAGAWFIRTRISLMQSRCNTWLIFPSDYFVSFYHIPSHTSIM